MDLILAILTLGGSNVFKKAGEPPIAAIIPLYNLVIMGRILNKPLIWVLFMMIPLYNLLVWWNASEDFCKAFGKGGDSTFRILTFLGIGIILIGFSDAKYVGTKASPDEFNKMMAKAKSEAKA